MPKKPPGKKSRKVLGRKALKKARGGALKSYPSQPMDENVLVAFKSGDLKPGVVLGSVWSTDPPPTDSKK